MKLRTFVFVALFLLIASFNVSAAPATMKQEITYLSNWNFSAWSSTTVPTSWTQQYATGGFKSTDGFFGTNAYGINGGGAAQPYGYINHPISLSAGNYKVVAVVKTTGRTSGKFGVDVCNMTDWRTYGGIRVEQNQDHTRIEFPVVIPANEYSGNLNIRTYLDASYVSNVGFTAVVSGIMIVPDYGNVTANEIQDENVLYCSFPYTPNNLFSPTIYQGKFTTLHPGAYSNITSSRLTVDGVNKSFWRLGDYFWFDATGMTQVPHAVTVSATYPQSSIPAEAKYGPYHGTIADGDYQLFADAGGFDFISEGWATRFMQTGEITKAKFFIRNVGTINDFKIKIWHKNEATGLYDQTYSTANLRSQLTNGLNVLDLSDTPIPVSTGDRFSIYMQGTGNANNTCFSVTPSDADYHAKVAYVHNPSTTAYNWDGVAGWAGSLGIEFYGDRPTIIFFGDSIISGMPNSYAFTDQQNWCNVFAPTKDIAGKMYALNPHFDYQNLGITGDTYPNLYNRFNADVVQKKPNYAVIEGGVNNFFASQSAATVYAYAEDQIEMCLANGITPIFVLCTPTSQLTIPQQTQMNAYNQLILDYNSSHTGVIVVDTRDELGAYNGSAWVPSPGMTTDGLHLSEGANFIVGQEIYDAIMSATQNPTVAVKQLVEYNTTVTLYANGGIIDHVVWRDGNTVLSETSDTLVYTGTEAGLHNITATVYFPDGGSGAPQSFYINVKRQMANSTAVVKKINNPVPIEKVIDDVTEFNVTGTAEDVTSVFTNLVGNMFYAWLFAVPIIGMWINQRKLTMPTTLFLLFGWIFIGFVPAQFHYVIWIAIAVSFAIPFLKFIHPD